MANQKQGKNHAEMGKRGKIRRKQVIHNEKEGKISCPDRDFYLSSVFPIFTTMRVEIGGGGTGPLMTSST